MQGCSADTFWCRVVERLQAAPTGLVTARLADAVRGGLEGEGQAEAPAQVACNVLWDVSPTTPPIAAPLFHMMLTCRQFLMQ